MLYDAFGEYTLQDTTMWIGSSTIVFSRWGVGTSDPQQSVQCLAKPIQRPYESPAVRPTLAIELVQLVGKSCMKDKREGTHGKARSYGCVKERANGVTKGTAREEEVTLRCGAPRRRCAPASHFHQDRVKMKA